MDQCSVVCSNLVRDAVLPPFPAGRAGFVGTRNYELDSGAYFIGLLWNFAATPGIRRPGTLLRQPLVSLSAATSH